MIAVTLLSSLVLSACDPGLWEYGYLYNPKGVLFRLYEALRTNDAHGDLGILFEGKMTCVYSSPSASVAGTKNQTARPHTSVRLQT